MVPFTRVPFWVPIFDPQPYVSELHRTLQRRHQAFRVQGEVLTIPFWGGGSQLRSVSGQDTVAKMRAEIAQDPVGGVGGGGGGRASA